MSSRMARATKRNPVLKNQKKKKKKNQNKRNILFIWEGVCGCLDQQYVLQSWVNLTDISMISTGGKQGSKISISFEVVSAA